MNIFVILIMGIMLATYQYFTSKRSSDVVLNKDELKLQAELTCLKQFHDFASSKNEFITNSENNIVSLKGNGENQINYTCTGSDDPTLTVSKYCLSASGQELVNCNFEGISCEDSSATAPGYHCVSTTKWKSFTKDDKYLTSQILKTGVNIASNALSEKLYLVKDRGAIFSSKPTDVPKNAELRGIGLVSCVNACKVNLQIKLQNATECTNGEIIVPRDDGTFVCAKPTDASPCTAHEEEGLVKKSEFCTEKNNKYCCPITYHQGDEAYCQKDIRPSNCCPPGTGPEWNAGLRFYQCKDETKICNGSFPMKVVDEKGNPITTLGSNGYVNVGDGSNPAATAKYKFDNLTKMGGYYCHLTQSSFVEKCKSFENADFSYLKVSNITNNTTITSADFANKKAEIQPVCHLASKANAKSTENCSPCQGVEFDQLNNKWKCKNYSWEDIKSNKDNARNVVFGENAKGLKSCLSSCSANQIDAIKSGKRNGKYWGLRWDEKSKMWNCFNCKPSDTYNYVWHCSGGAPINASEVDPMDDSLTHNSSVTLNQRENITITKCKPSADARDSSQGKCIPFNCATEFQVQINGQCYTKWCNRNLPGFPDSAEINEPRSSNCPTTSPWMAYNQVKTCVYCVRTPPEKGSDDCTDENCNTNTENTETNP